MAISKPARKRYAAGHHAAQSAVRSAPRRLNALLTLLVRVGGLGLYSRDFNRQVFLQEV